MIAPNTIVGGRYRVVKPLGGGGMKLVYLAEDLRLAARRCALAEVVDNFTNPDAQRQAVDAFQREADMLARLNNEHIPRVFDRFSEQNHHYLVMEYIDGATLEEEMKHAGGRLAESRVIDIALQILDTLEYLHGLEPPVIYRDLKPSNVMLMASGQAKLIDFGIARHFQPQQNATMIGTQGYAPPEQYRGKVELRSDLYALGATMHHALSGRDPANEAPFSFPPLTILCPDARPALAALVDDALAYDVERRVPSAAEFKRRLEEIRDGVAPTGAQAPSAANHTDHATHPPATGASQSTMAPPRAASGPSRSQLRLPLGRANAPASPSAPTLLRTASEVNCSTCGRVIPSDSRFCSFCGAEVSIATAEARDAGDHEADTVLLSVPHSVDDRSRVRLRGERLYHRTHGARRPILVLVLIFVGAFAAVKVVSCLNVSGDNSGGNSPDATRADAPTPAVPGAPAPDSPSATPEFLSMRLQAFRAALDASGYSSVRFHMVGDTMVLTGTVPTATDEAIVQMLALNFAGVVSLKDQIRVQNGFAGP
ncbi:MAG: serine/threonine protein kinase [Candidatus Binataceae bacterium]